MIPDRPPRRDLSGDVGHLAECRPEVEHVLLRGRHAGQFGLRLSDPRGEASQARREVARQIFELGEVKQSFPPTTQVSELLLKRLGPGVVQSLIGSDRVERCNRRVQVIGIKEPPKPSIQLAGDGVGIDQDRLMWTDSADGYREFSDPIAAWSRLA